MNWLFPIERSLPLCLIRLWGSPVYSDAEVWNCTHLDWMLSLWDHESHPALKASDTLPSSTPTHPSMDSQLICSLTKAVEDLALAWSAPEEPACGLSDEWFRPSLYPGPDAFQELHTAWLHMFSKAIRLLCTQRQGTSQKGMSPVTDVTSVPWEGNHFREHLSPQILKPYLLNTLHRNGQWLSSTRK